MRFHVEAKVTKATETELKLSAHWPLAYRTRLIGVAIKAQNGRVDRFVEAMDRRMEDPDAFAWQHALRWADKACWWK